MSLPANQLNYRDLSASVCKSDKLPRFVCVCLQIGQTAEICLLLSPNRTNCRNCQIISDQTSLKKQKTLYTPIYSAPICYAYPSAPVWCAYSGVPILVCLCGVPPVWCAYSGVPVWCAACVVCPILVRLCGVPTVWCAYSGVPILVCLCGVVQTNGAPDKSTGVLRRDGIVRTTTPSASQCTQLIRIADGVWLQCGRQNCQAPAYCFAFSVAAVVAVSRCSCATTV